MKINYPVLNISLLEWNNEIIEEIFREDDIYHSSDDDFFSSYLLGHEFVDCKGNIYKLVKKVPITNFWTRLFTSKRGKLLFEATGKEIKFDVLQQLMIERIGKLKGEEAKQEWINKLKNAREIKDLLQ